MLERLKQIPQKLLEFWKKLTTRQRVISISSVAAVVITLVILIILLNRVQYETLTTFDSTSAAKSAMETLNNEGIANRLQDDNLTVEVDVLKKQDAVLALTGDESAEGLSLATLLENDLSTTSNDKMLKSHLYVQTTIANRLMTIDGIDKASVIYFPADNSNRILQTDKDICCSIFLTINEQFDAKTTPTSIATAVAYAIGNTTTDKIKVIDQHGNLLFGGEEEDQDIQDLNANLAYKKLVEKWYNDKLFELAIKNGYTDAEIVSHLEVNCDKTSILYTEYLAGEGLEQGLYSTYKKISSETTGASGDIPGTDSNDETDYYISTQNSGNSSYDELDIKYIPSERVTETQKEWGVINNAQSSLGIVLTRVREYTEEELNLMGVLEGTTFEQYALEHGERVILDTGTEAERIEILKQLFSDASGIPVNEITITSYEVPSYIPNEVVERNVSMYLEILLALLIIGLLLFVVFRAMQPEEVIETEPELSVERLLATTKENQSLEDIEFGEKSETRKLIEKYIDENPEAVAALLRNWLRDDGWE